MYYFKSHCLMVLGPTISVAMSIPGQTPSPSVTIGNGTVIGQRNNSIESFIGIPYAQPPLGQLRLRPPQALNESFGTLSLPQVATACPQMNLSSFNLSSYPAGTIEVLQTFFSNYSLPEAEDCLSVTVQRPANISAKLPVLFWIYGGGFETGSTAETNGASLIAKSVNMSRPMIFVTANYRANAFGFLPGKQVQDEGVTNLGLRDQRKALEWVAENIAAFGGDPERVTIWGESAGSVSVFSHLLINNGDHRYNGKPLFRGAIMDSGSILRALPMNSSKAQTTFDTVAAAAGCSAVQSHDILTCLRDVPYATLKTAANAVPNFAGYEGGNIYYYPRPDATSSFFSNTAAEALARGAFARVPIIIGDQEDEGTIFSLQQSNLTDTADLVDYYASWFPTTPREQIAGLVNTYPDNATAGSPFGTGNANEIYPQYKRNAALMGDYLFTLAARQTLMQFACHLPAAWSYLATYFHGFPLLGTFHASDVTLSFGGLDFPAGRIQDGYYINFVDSLDPNGKDFDHWPMWDQQGLRMLNISMNTTSILRGDFRWKSYEYLVDHPDAFFL